MLLLLLTLAKAACPGGPTNNASLQRQVESSLFSFVELDDQGFEAYRSAAVDSVYCLDELIHPHLAAEFLRLEGVRAFTAKDEAFAGAAFRAAKTLEPTHQLPTTMAPTGGPLHKLYMRADRLPMVPWNLPEGDFRTYVNGIPSSTAPNGIAIVQIVLPDGSIVYSGIVTSRSDLPPSLLEDLATRVAENPPVGPTSPDPLEPDAPRKKRGPVPVITGLAAGTAVALLGGSVLSRQRYDIAPTASRRRQTNALYLASIGTGAVGAMFAVTLVLPTRESR